MRFLLVNPFYPISECPSPPLGLAYLAGALEQAGIEVRVLDLVMYKYSPQRLEAVLDEFQPHLVGATAVTMTYDHAASILADAKALDPGLKTVMGGPHVTFCAEETMLLNPNLDFIVLGEGEEAVVRLARAVEKNKGFEEITGLVFRRNNEPVFTGPREPGLDVNRIPMPARHLLPLGRYRTLGLAISMTTSRGCPFKCIFCVGRRMVGAKVRYRDPVKVVDEMETLAARDFPQINIVDDLFTANKKHCHAVCDEILRRGLKVKWTSFARVDTVSREVLAHMKEAGCGAVSFGVESGNAEILKTVEKGITLDGVIAAVQMCNDAGVTPMASFILGLPGETPETVQETVAFGQKLNDLGVSHGYHLLAPFPGTKVREESERYGIKILTHDWRQYHANRAIVETASARKAMLDEVAMKWERQFDEYLGHIKEKMKTGEAADEEASILVNLERTVLTYDLLMDEVVEAHGFWPDDGGTSEEQDIETLAGRVARAAGRNETEVAAALEYARVRKSLRRSREDGLTRWAWVDYL
ncbi:MAG: radical SAM protein [Thermodesulfobacteriota bacterium]